LQPQAGAGYDLPQYEGFTRARSSQKTLTFGSVRASQPNNTRGGLNA
jgi:hypothetical protein